MREHHVALDQMKVVCQSRLTLTIDHVFFKLTDECGRDAEDRVAGEVLIAIGKYLRDHHFVLG